MLTIFKEIFTWWNRQTLGTRIKTFFSGKLIGEDEYGNKYYQNKKGIRWIIYKEQVEASNIPSEWYSWMHYTKNKIENILIFKKYLSTIHYLSFNVANPIIAKIIDIIQNLITTVDSGQPFFSK